MKEGDYLLEYHQDPLSYRYITKITKIKGNQIATQEILRHNQETPRGNLLVHDKKWTQEVSNDNPLTGNITKQTIEYNIGLKFKYRKLTQEEKAILMAALI